MSKLAGGSVSGGRRCTEGLAVPADAPSASPGKAYRGREEQVGAGLREEDERGGWPGCSSSGGGRGAAGPPERALPPTKECPGPPRGAWRSDVARRPC